MSKCLLLTSLLLTAALAIEDFVPLSCNTRYSLCRTWSARFGASNVHNQRVTIECGECVRMNHAGSQLRLNGGLDIQGKLIFPDGYEGLEILTPMVAVQGELEMTATKPVDGVPSVKFTMTGRGVNQYFTPVDSNALACGVLANGNPQDCEGGENSITVAGGKVTIKGMHEDAPSWVRLYDVMGSPDWDLHIPDDSFEQYQPVPGGCPADGILVDTGREVATDRIERVPTLHDMVQRMLEPLTDRFGVALDLIDPACLTVDRTYLVTARVRLWKEGVETGTLTACAQTDTGCLAARYSYQQGGGTVVRNGKWREYPSHQTRYGEAYTITFPFQFQSNEIGGSRTPYEMLFVAGEGEGVEVEDFIMRLPPPETYPTSESVCAELVLGNGDAESVGRSPFPFDLTNREIRLVVEEEADGNNYFAVSGRHGNIDTTAGLSWDLVLPCIREDVIGAIYKFEADFRMHTPGGSATNTTIYIEKQGSRGRQYKKIVECPTSDGGTWFHCASEFELSIDLITDNVVNLRLLIDTGGAEFDYDVDNISLRFMRSPANNVALTRDILGHWEAGAEIVFTSYTYEWDNHQERTIVSVHDDYENNGYVRVVLNEPITRPTTIKESPNFAVEVALLSRNILFDAGADVNPTEGGHFWVMHTPTVVQEIDAVEIRHFGQAGNLGRYPLHFHFCKDLTGSRMARNSIRWSNQRCVVVHGTDNAMIQDNVAYDTRGHCYIVEDGIETGNTFLRNFGAKNGRPERIISRETDNMPSIFWITNPTNSWIDNVAAGSEDSGFWFEPQRRGQRAGQYEHLNPVYDDMTAFTGNVAHSNGEMGIRTYPNTGYTPYNDVTFKNMTIYRNRNTGIFIHTSSNMFVEDSLFADNGQSVDLDRADNTTIRNNVFIGLTDIYREQMFTQAIDNVCFSSRVTAVELHTWRDDWKKPAIVVENNVFYGFSDTGCGRESTIRVDDTIDHGRFESPGILQGLDLQDGNEGHIDFCPGVESGVDFFFTDMDGTLSPSSSPTTEPSTMVGNTETMLHYITDNPNCITEDFGCYTYCKGVCFRSVRYEIAPNIPTDWGMNACPIDAPTDCVFFPNLLRRGYGYETSDTRKGTVVVHLPPGRQYTTTFVDGRGNDAWPNFVRETFQGENDALCPTAWADEDVQLIVPPVSAGECRELIKNGDAELGSEPTHWNDARNGIVVVPFQGVGLSSSFAGIDMHFHSVVVQHLDTRCFALNVGKTYRVRAYIKLRRANGTTKDCDTSTEFRCPMVGFTLNEDAVDIVIGEVAPGIVRQGFQLVEEDIVITPQMAAANDVKFYIQANQMNWLMYFDDVSIREV